MRVQGFGFGIQGWAAGLCLAAVLAAGCGQATPEKDFQAGLALLRKGDLAAGKARLESALERDPSGAFAAEAQNWLGLANGALGLTAAHLLGMGAGECSIRKGSVWWLRQRQRLEVSQTVLMAVMAPDFL